MTGNNISKVVNNLVIKFLATGTPVFGPRKFMNSVAKPLYTEKFRFAMKIRMNLVAKCAEKNHLQALSSLAGKIFQIRLRMAWRFGGSIIMNRFYLVTKATE